MLVKDLETSQVTIKEFQSRLTVSERRGDDLAAKLREMTNLFEKADKGRLTHDVRTEQGGRGVTTGLLQGDSGCPAVGLG